MRTLRAFQIRTTRSNTRKIVNTISIPKLVGFDSRVLYELSPLLQFHSNDRVEFGRRVAERVRAYGEQRLFHFGCLQCLDEFLVQAADDGLRRARRGQSAEP